MTKRIYIAGPMNGVPEFNFPAFHRAAAYYRELGYTVFNPAENDIEKMGFDPSRLPCSAFGDGAALADATGFSVRNALADDLSWISLNADAIHMLPGWEHSTGAFAEWALAKAHKLQFFYGAL